MAYAYEAHESPQYADDGSLTRTFIVEGSQDALQSEGVAFGAASTDYEGRIRGNKFNTERLGFSTFKCGIKYELPPQDPSQQPPNNDPPQGIIEFDTAGGTQHITTAKAQTHYPQNAPDMKRAIGVGRDTVEGVDIIVPSLQFTVTRHFPIAQITGGYIKDLARLTGKTNKLDYDLDGETFEAGELLFMGASGGCRGRPDWEIAFRFQAEQNNTNLDVSPTITGITKKGHQYLWVRFKQEESQNNLVQVPEFAYVATVYEEEDFKAILGF